MQTTAIGIIGDFNPSNPMHIATDASIEHSAEIMKKHFKVSWLSTDKEHDLNLFHGFICSSGSPYKSFDGALKSIRNARENSVPLLGTCGGFQHMVIEYARNVAGVHDAEHAERHPGGKCLVVTPLACSLVGQMAEVSLKPGSRVAAAYGCQQTTESFLCSFGINPAYRHVLETAGLRVCGYDENGDVRAAELPSHPFFVGTLFVPQARSRMGQPHPLILELCRKASQRTN